MNEYMNEPISCYPDSRLEIKKRRLLVRFDGREDEYDDEQVELALVDWKHALVDLRDVAHERRALGLVVVRVRFEYLDCRRREVAAVHIKIRVSLLCNMKKVCF